MQIIYAKFTKYFLSVRQSSMDLVDSYVLSTLGHEMYCQDTFYKKKMLRDQTNL